MPGITFSVEEDHLHLCKYVVAQRTHQKCAVGVLRYKLLWMEKDYGRIKKLINFDLDRHLSKLVTKLVA